MFVVLTIQHIDHQVIYLKRYGFKKAVFQIEAFLTLHYFLFLLILALTVVVTSTSKSTGLCDEVQNTILTWLFEWITKQSTNLIFSNKLCLKMNKILWLITCGKDISLIASQKSSNHQPSNQPSLRFPRFVWRKLVYRTFIKKYLQLLVSDKNMFIMQAIVIKKLFWQWNFFHAHENFPNIIKLFQTSWNTFHMF